MGLHDGLTPSLQGSGALCGLGTSLSRSLNRLDGGRAKHRAGIGWKGLDGLVDPSSKPVATTVMLNLVAQALVERSTPG